MIKYYKFKDLFRARNNVRVVNPSNAADQELQASVRAVGILQNLVVVEHPDGRGEVYVGGRRLSCVETMFNAGECDGDYLIPALPVEEEQAVLISLIENAHREGMHPADEFMAYAKLIEQGRTVEEIAVILGVKKNHVKKLLRLGEVAPVIVEAFRANKLDLEDVMAFTVSEDQEKQLACYDALKRSGSLYAHMIRRYLTDTYLKSTDPLVKFVSLAAYRKANGSTTSDLFQNVTYVLDAALVQRLAEEKLEKLRVEEGAGWAWSEIAFSNREMDQKGRQISAEYAGVPEELELEIKATDKEIDDLEEREYTDAWTEEDDNRQNALVEKREELESQREAYRAFTDDQKSLAGCVVFIDYEGKPQVRKGIVRKEDEKALKAVERGESPEAAAATSSEESQSLRADLNAYYQQALQCVLMTREDVALDMLIFSLAEQVLRGSYMQKLLEMRIEPDMVDVPGIRETKAAKAIQQAREALNLAWIEAEGQAERWAGFCELTKKDKQRIMAFCVARMLRSPKRDWNADTGAAIRKAVDFKLSEHWQPTADNYFGRLKKKQVLAIGASVIDEQWADDHRKTPKDLLCDLLLDAGQMQGWMPEYLKD